MKQFTSKCKNSKNKIKGFGDFFVIMEITSVLYVLTDPVKSDVRWTKSDQINRALSDQFDAIGSMQISKTIWYHDM